MQTYNNNLSCCGVQHSMLYSEYEYWIIVARRRSLHQLVGEEAEPAKVAMRSFWPGSRPIRLLFCKRAEGKASSEVNAKSVLSQKIILVVLICYCCRYIPPLDTILNEKNPIQPLIFLFFYFKFNIILILAYSCGPDSSVSIATRYGLVGPGIECQCGRDFPYCGPGAHPAYQTMGTGSFPWVKRPGRGVDHPPHLSPRLKEEYSYISTPPLGLRGLL